MSESSGEGLENDRGLYIISIAAELTGTHPQTLRHYDRVGLLSPSRTIGRDRRYSIRDISRLKRIQSLIEEGINHSGIKKIFELETHISLLTAEINKLRIDTELILIERESKALVIRKKTQILIYINN